MIKYGQSSFKKEVATKEYFKKFIRCVDKLPDVDDAVVDTVVQLIGREAGRTVTHQYVLTEVGSEKKWIELDEKYRDATLITPPEGSYYLQISKDFIIGSSAWSGYLNLDWKLPDGERPLWFSIVRKRNGYPLNIRDGHLLVSIAPTENSGVYQYDDAMHNNAEQVDMMYSIFFIYASGRTSVCHGSKIE